MNESASPQESQPSLDDLVRSFRAGKDDGTQLCSLLEIAARNAVRGFLGLDEGTQDDCVQDALVGILYYLRRDREFDGDVAKLCVSIARNRCRDVKRRLARRPEIPIDPMTEWLEDSARSALDLIEKEQRRSLLQIGLDSLDAACRRLLHRIFVQGISADTIRKEEKLASVQAVYYRRDICLQRARKNLKAHLAGALKKMNVAATGEARSSQGRANYE